jgi:hypothetical protein
MAAGRLPDFSLLIFTFHRRDSANPALVDSSTEFESVLKNHDSEFGLISPPAATYIKQ